MSQKTVVAVEASWTVWVNEKNKDHQDFKPESLQKA